jgi:hypothetical protein
LSEIPTSARLPGAPVPSTTVPFLMRMSKMGTYPVYFWWRRSNSATSSKPMRALKRLKS